MSNRVDIHNMAISAKNAPPTYRSQTCLQGTANQKKTGLKANEIKQLVFDRGWSEELHQSPIKDKYRGMQPTRFKLLLKFWLPVTPGFLFCQHIQIKFGHIYSLFFPINPSIFCHLSNSGLQVGGWSLSKLPQGERKGTPWTSHQSVTETDNHSHWWPISGSPNPTTCML